MMRFYGIWRSFIQPLLWRKGHWAHWIRMGPTILFWFGGPAAYKLDSSDGQMIKTKTGQQAADLTEDELAVMLQKLGIRKVELDQDDIAALRQAEAREM